MDGKWGLRAKCHGFSGEGKRRRRRRRRRRRKGERELRECESVWGEKEDGLGFAIICGGKSFQRCLVICRTRKKEI